VETAPEAAVDTTTWYQTTQCTNRAAALPVNAEEARQEGCGVGRLRGSCLVLDLLANLRWSRRPCTWLGGRGGEKARSSNGGLPPGCGRHTEETPKDALTSAPSAISNKCVWEVSAKALQQGCGYLFQEETETARNRDLTGTGS